MVGGGRAVAAAVLAAAAVCLLVSAAHRGGRVELEESNAERIARLQEEAKAKTIEARISQTASQLERERAVREKNAAEAQATQRNAMRDKREAEGDFSKAKTLASAAARAEQAARLAAHRAKSAAHVLHLKMRVAGLLKSRAEDEEHRAMQAQVCVPRHCSPTRKEGQLGAPGCPTFCYSAQLSLFLARCCPSSCFR